MFLAAPGSRGLLPGPAIYRSPRRATGNDPVNSNVNCPPCRRRIDGNGRSSSSSTSRGRSSTIMQFGRRRVVDQRVGAKTQQQIPVNANRQEAAAGAVHVTRGGRGMTSKGSGAVVDLDRRRGTEKVTPDAAARKGRAAATAAIGVGGSAMQSLRHVRTTLV